MNCFARLPVSRHAADCLSTFTHRGSKRCPWTKSLPWLVAILVVGVGSAPLVAGTILVSADLQMLGYPGQLAQPGWQVTEVFGGGVDGSQPLLLTPAGAASGISATLLTAGSWYSRGGPDADRAYVQGTSFDGVVSDLWFTRDMTFSLALTGLMAGESYLLRAWHNDSYTLNGGAAAGGGTVHPTLSGGTVTSSADGTVTNLYGIRNDADFGITEMLFQPSSSIATVTFTRNGGSFNGVPLSGVELTVDAVPEPSMWAMGAAGLGYAAFGAWRRRWMRG